MTKQLPSITAEYERFGARATYDSENKTIISRIDTDVPFAAAATLAGKLASFNCLMNGDGFDVFDGMADSHKRNLIWMLDDLAHELMVLTELTSVIDCMPSKPEGEGNHG